MLYYPYIECIRIVFQWYDAISPAAYSPFSVLDSYSAAAVRHNTRR